MTSRTTIGLLAESGGDERRVALTPDETAQLVERGWNVLVESGAGELANFTDDMYASAGAELADDARDVLRTTDVVVKIDPPAQRLHDDEEFHEAELLDTGDVWISLLHPERNPEAAQQLRDAGATAFALERVPRISRAQSLDVLSSMAGVAGYRAVIEAAWAYDRFVGSRTTAAGSTPPADMLVIGAGVAGLAAIATGRDLGAQVRAFDVRPAVREEVESLGGDFLMLDLPLEKAGDGEQAGYATEMGEEFLEAERDLFRDEVPGSDLVVTTAAIPGRPAPKLVTEPMVEQMRPGSVIVDLAAETGGNCVLTEQGEAVEHHGVQILGYTDLASRMASHASEFFGQNLLNLFRQLGDPDEFHIDRDDEVIRAMLAIDAGTSLDPIQIEPTDTSEPPEEDERTTPAAEKPSDDGSRTAPKVLGALAAIAAVAFTTLVATSAPPSFVQHLTVFVLACFVGWRVIWDVTSSLHTPLMSVTNAISGIIIVGGILQVTTQASPAARWFGAAAMLVASINIFGGFAVTQRMLGMFRAEDEESE